MIKFTVKFMDPRDAMKFKSELETLNEENFERKKRFLGEDRALELPPIYSGVKLSGYSVSCDIPSEVYATNLMPLVCNSAVAINF